MAFPVTPDEPLRLAALRELAILDTAPEQIYDDVVALASAICHTPIAVVSFVDEDRQWGKAVVGLDDAELPREHSFCARAIVRDGLVVDDLAADPEFAASPLVTGDPNLRFYAGAPIVDESGHALGTVCVADRSPRSLDESQLEALRVLARQTAAHLDLRRRSHQLEEANGELRRLAVEDPLTGLPNRTLLYDRIGRALAGRARTGRGVGILFCDLDAFKDVNDRHGHQAGDTVLRAVAERLQAAARTVDTVARLAGDEFVVVCPDVACENDLRALAARMRQAVERPISVGGTSLTPAVSIGAALAEGPDDADQLLRRADAAMYDAKRATAPAGA